MSLQGSLETFALPDVFVLLSSTKKDGELRVVGGSVEGRVWLEKGQIVATSIRGRETKAVDAVWELLRLDDGHFAFEPDSKPPRRGEAQMIDLVLADAQVRLTEWREIAKVVPSLDASVDMAAKAPADEVVLTAEQWELLRTVAGGVSVSDLMERLQLGEFDTCKTVKELVDDRLVTIDAPGRRSQSKPSRPAAAPTPEPEPELEPELARPAPRAEKRSAPAVEERPASIDLEERDEELDALAELAPRTRRTRSASASVTAAVDEPAEPDESRSTKGQTGDEAKALVAQLAALGGDDEEEVAKRVAEHVAQGGELPEVAEGDEPINRGLLLKFLSSVRN